MVVRVQGAPDVISMHTLSLNCSLLGVTQGFAPDMPDAVYTITRPKNWSILNISCAQHNLGTPSFKELAPKTLSHPAIETLIDESHSILKKLPMEILGVRKSLALASLGEAMT